MGCSSKDAFPASQIDDFVMRQLYRLMTGSDRDDFIEVEFVDGHSVINPYVINAPQANVMAMSAAVAALSYVFMSRLLVGKNKEMRLRKTTASSSSYTTRRVGTSLMLCALSARYVGSARVRFCCASRRLKPSGQWRNRIRSGPPNLRR